MVVLYVSDVYIRLPVYPSLCMHLYVVIVFYSTVCGGLFVRVFITMYRDYTDTDTI